VDNLTLFDAHGTALPACAFCGALRLEITCTPGTVHLWWEDSAAPQFWRVETAPTPRGPWQTLGETTNPHWSQPITTRNAFFRIRGVSVQGGNR
jgi:hypothetical protein